MTIKVFHVELLADGTHHYFGSKKAITDHLSKEQIGIGYGALRNAQLTSEIPFINKKCIIREGLLQTAKTE